MTMLEWCTCTKCRENRGGGKAIAMSTWYAHNPGGKKGPRIADRLGSRVDAVYARRNEPVQRDRSPNAPSGSGSSMHPRKRPAEDDIDLLDRAKRAARSDSVR